MKQTIKDNKVQFEYAKLFIKFLKKHNALNAFVKNLEYMREFEPDDINYTKGTLSESGFLHLPDRIDRLLLDSFCWTTSIESPKINWDGLNEKWYLFINDFSQRIEK